jgi:hypothetical protein
MIGNESALKAPNQKALCVPGGKDVGSLGEFSIVFTRLNPEPAL